MIELDKSMFYFIVEILVLSVGFNVYLFIWRPSKKRTPKKSTLLSALAQLLDKEMKGQKPGEAFDFLSSIKNSIEKGDSASLFEIIYHRPVHSPGTQYTTGAKIPHAETEKVYIDKQNPSVYKDELQRLRDKLQTMLTEKTEAISKYNKAVYSAQEDKERFTNEIEELKEKNSLLLKHKDAILDKLNSLKNVKVANDKLKAALEKRTEKSHELEALVNDLILENDKLEKTIVSMKMQDSDLNESLQNLPSSKEVKKEGSSKEAQTTADETSLKGQGSELLAKVEPLINEIRPLLEDYDTAAFKHFDALYQLLANSPYQNFVIDVQNYIKNYEYEKALNKMDELLATLKL